MSVRAIHRCRAKSAFYRECALVHRVLVSGLPVSDVVVEWAKSLSLEGWSVVIRVADPPVVYVSRRRMRRKT